MPRLEKTDFCDACYAPWYPRLYDADGEPMENLCDECSELIDEEPAGLGEEDDRPPICSCGVTMVADEDDEGEIVYVCGNDECPYYGIE
jgi:hypothetical protein